MAKHIIYGREEKIPKKLKGDHSLHKVVEKRKTYITIDRISVYYECAKTFVAPLVLNGHVIFQCFVTLLRATENNACDHINDSMAGGDETTQILKRIR